MQIIGRITWRGDVQGYQSKTGEARSVLKFRLTAGSDNIVVTAFTEQIGALTAIQNNVLVAADVTVAAREWQTQTGTVQHATEVTLNRISPL